MKKSVVISVIIPVYRVEKYLEECIDSILAQTYRDLEIILIDDSSPDRCGAICDRYAQTDSRIIVIHQKNGGAAAARNAGLRIASGELITFVDSDDFLCPDAYENMAAAMAAENADIVHSNFRFVYPNTEQVHTGYAHLCHFTARQYLLRFLEDWTCALCWDKLFRRHVLEHVFFEEGHLIDDEFFTYQAVLNAGKIVGIPAVTYNYRQRASSVMKNPTTMERKAGDILDFLDKRLNHVTARFSELRPPYERHYADYLMWLATSDLASEQTVRRIRKRLIAFVADGRVPFWKQGHRKQALKIAVFLMKPTKKILQCREEGTEQGEYTFFE